MSNNINFNNKETNNNNKNKLIKKFIIASIIIGILGTGLSGYSIIAALTRTFEGESLNTFAKGPIGDIETPRYKPPISSSLWISFAAKTI